MAGSGVGNERKRRLAALVADEEQTMLALVARVSVGGTFDEICRDLDVPRTKLLVWLQEDDGRWGMFLKAHEARAINYVSEVVGIADGEGDAADKKLRVETRFRYAKHHAPGLYGADDGGGGGVGGPTLSITVMVAPAGAGQISAERVVNEIKGDGDGTKGASD